jgi:ribosomal protein S18 acetylase RimI-like enzyme
MPTDLPPGVILRRGIPADAAALLELAIRTYDETFAAVNTPENMQTYLSTAFTLAGFRSDLENPAVVFQVAEAGQRPIAYAKMISGPAPVCVEGGSPIEIERFYLDREWHGSGIANAMMRECLRTARLGGFQTVFLGVWEHNLRARAFYTKWGFRRVGEHVFQMGDDAQTDWWLARPAQLSGESE